MAWDRPDGRSVVGDGAAVGGEGVGWRDKPEHCTEFLETYLTNLIEHGAKVSGFVRQKWELDLASVLRVPMGRLQEEIYEEVRPTPGPPKTRGRRNSHNRALPPSPCK